MNNFNTQPYTNPYMTNNSYSPYNMNLNMAPQPLPTTLQQNQTQPVVDTSNFVSKEDYEQLLQEKRKLQEQLENEISQRVDIEFFKKEQEMIRLPEGQRMLQELDYQKNQFFEAFWRTSESGKNAMKKYRESINMLYDTYALRDIGTKRMNDTPIDTRPAEEEETVF